MRGEVAGEDPWTRRAVRHRDRNLDAIRRKETYDSPDRYSRVVADLNRLVERSVPDVPGSGIRISLANYQDDRLAPTRTRDLLRAAEIPEANPFIPVLAPRLIRTMETFQPDAVGISLNYLSQALCAFALIGFIRRRWPDTAILLGGGLVTSWAGRLAKADGRLTGCELKPASDSVAGATSEFTLKGTLGTLGALFSGLVDAVISGPGEAPLLQWLDKAALGKVPSGLPKYGLFPLKNYFAPGLILPYAASRGCYWNRCAFCPEPAEGNRYAPVGRGRVVGDLRTLAEGHRPVLLHLVDNALSPALLDELIRTPPGPPWYGFVRFFPRLADPEYCRALRRAGCVMLKLGLESGSQAVLDRENKGVNLDLAERVLENLRLAGIARYVYLLFGTPSESEYEARATLKFTVRNSHAISFLNLALFNLPLAGRGRAGLEVLPYDDDLSLYAGFRHPKGWDRHLVRRFLDREFRRHPAVAAILRRDPPVFTSNHAPFFGDCSDT
ncbi:radical SAM protein [Desulfonatronum sp. SC1]|nr:radical SAM protein [Desulfonatronum sp. SC1]